MVASSIVRRPIRSEVRAPATIITDTLARIATVRGRMALYGVTDPTRAELLAGSSIEADFTRDYFRTSFVSSADPAVLPGWTFSRTGSGTSESANGVVEDFTTDEARITDLGLLVEGQSTNLLLHSRDLTQASWVKRNAVVVAVDAAQARPDGTLGAMKVSNLSGGPGVNDFYAIVAATDGQRYEPSFDLLKVSATGTVELSNPGGTGLWTINLALCPDVWTRITRDHPAVIVAQEFVGASGFCGHFFYNPSGTAVSFYVDNAQLEFGGMTSSRIITNGSTATREAESARTTAALGSEGGLFVEFELSGAAGTTQTAVSLDAANGFDPFLAIYRSPADYLTIDLTKAGLSMQGFLPGYGGTRTVQAALSWRDGQVFASIDGTALPPLAFDGFLSFTRLWFGRPFTLSSLLNGRVRRVAAFDAFLEEAERIAMTGGA